MAMTPALVPVRGLHDLSNETRMIRAVEPHGARHRLGQYPMDYDPDAAAQIRKTFDPIGGEGPAVQHLHAVLPGFSQTSC